MERKLYIPKRIKVGFQNRTDTYTGKLGYVIYYDDKNVLRKEKSWESWRDKKIDSVEFDNVPTNGFTINKDIKRGGWDWFSTARSMIRLHDPRDFEFEITPSNLTGILMHSDCLRRGLQEKFVYAWNGTELALLPINSEEYEKSLEFTKLQGQKVSAKNLVPGAVYETKQQEKLTFIGRFMWYNNQVLKEDKKDKKQKRRRYYNYETTTRVGSLKYIWAETIGKKPSLVISSGLESIAQQVADFQDNYHTLLELFSKNPNSSQIKEYIWEPVEFDPKFVKDSYYGIKLNKKEYFIKEGESFRKINFHAENLRRYDPKNINADKQGYVIDGVRYKYYKGDYRITKDHKRIHKSVDDGTSNQYGYYNGSYYKDISLGEIPKLNLGNLYIVLENGNKMEYNKVYEY